MKKFNSTIFVAIFVIGCFGSIAFGQKASLEITNLRGFRDRNLTEIQAAAAIKQVFPDIVLVGERDPNRTHVIRVQAELNVDRAISQVDVVAYNNNLKRQQKIGYIDVGSDIGCGLGVSFLPRKARRDARRVCREAEKAMKQRQRMQMRYDRYEVIPVVSSVKIEIEHLDTETIVSRKIGRVETAFERKYVSQRRDRDFSYVAIGDDSLKSTGLEKGFRIAPEQENFEWLIRYAIAEAYNNRTSTIIGR